jgi:hypothetical protein
MILCDKMAKLMASGWPNATPRQLAVLAGADVVKGRALGSLGGYDIGAALAQRGIGRLTQLAERRPEVRPTLAEAVGRRGLMSKEVGRSAEAIRFLDQAIALYRDVVFKDGSYEFESELDLFVTARAKLVDERSA